MTSFQKFCTALKKILTKLAAWYPGGHHLWGFQTLIHPKIWYLVFLKNLILRMKKKKFRKRPKIFLFGPSARCKKNFFRTVADLSLQKKNKKNHTSSLVFAWKFSFCRKCWFSANLALSSPFLTRPKSRYTKNFRFPCFQTPMN